MPSTRGKTADGSLGHLTEVSRSEPQKKSGREGLKHWQESEMAALVSGGLRGL